MKLTLTKEELHTMVEYHYNLQKVDFQVIVTEPHSKSGRKVKPHADYTLLIVRFKSLGYLDLNDNIIAGQMISAIGELRYILGHDKCGLPNARYAVDHWNNFKKVLYMDGMPDLQPGTTVGYWDK